MSTPEIAKLPKRNDFFFNLGGYVVLIPVPVMSHVCFRNLFVNLHFFLIMLLYLTAEPVNSFTLANPEIELTTFR